MQGETNAEHARSSPHSLLLCAVLVFYLILSFSFCSTRFHLLLCYPAQLLLYPTLLDSPQGRAEGLGRWRARAVH